MLLQLSLGGVKCESDNTDGYTNPTFELCNIMDFMIFYMK